MSDNTIAENGVEKTNSPAASQQATRAAETKAPVLFAPAMQINITVKHSKFDGEIDMSKLTWKDAKRLRKLRAGLQDGSVQEDDLVDMIDDIILAVAGQAPDDLPAEVVNRICEILFQGDTAQSEAEKN